MKKIVVNMLSIADSIDGQGVGSAYLDLLTILKTKKELKIIINSKEKSNVIHVHSITPKYLFKIKTNRTKNIVSCHFLGDTLEGALKIPKFLMNIFKLYLKWFYRSADYLVIVSPFLKQGLLDMGIKEDKIIYIPNYVSNDKFYKINSIDKLKEKYGLDTNKKMVLGVGQLVIRKGIIDFIEIAKKFPDVQFVWCGDYFFNKMTDEYDLLKSAIDNHPKNVKFMGAIPRNEMNNFFNMCDIFFNPSYKESFSLTVLEAFLTEKPVILRDLDVYNDIFFDSYLKGNSDKEFINLLSNLLKDEKLYKEQIKKSKKIINFYNKENVLEMWYKLYKKLSGE